MTDLLKFFNILEKLKNTLRFKNGTSFTDKDADRRESTADHSYKMAMMILVIAEELKIKIDLLRAIKVALVHDLVEAVTDDIDYSLVFVGRIRKEDKRQGELDALPKMVEGLSPEMAQEITELWREYDENKTREAKFVKAIDKIEAIHTLLYQGEKSFDIPKLIPVHADKPVTELPELKPLLKEIKIALKKEYDEADIPWEDEYNYGVLND